MTNRTYRLLMGALLLIFLYFDLDTGVYALMFVMFLEGIFNILIPDMMNHLFYPHGLPSGAENLAPFQNKSRFQFAAERAWRLIVGVMLVVTYVLFNPGYTLLPIQLIENFSYYSWFFPWFMGFAIFGAGVSGICPVLTVIKWFGFK